MAPLPLCGIDRSGWPVDKLTGTRVSLLGLSEAPQKTTILLYRNDTSEYSLLPQLLKLEQSSMPSCLGTFKSKYADLMFIRTRTRNF